MSRQGFQVAVRTYVPYSSSPLNRQAIDTPVVTPAGINSDGTVLARFCSDIVKTV